MQLLYPFIFILCAVKRFTVFKRKAIQTKPFRMISAVILWLALGFIHSAAAEVYEDSAVLSLDKAIGLAQASDEWLIKSELLETRFKQLESGASAMPDPTISLGLLNLPTDGFAFNQEPMTQFRIGASQLLPRGDIRALAQAKFASAANEQPFKRAERRLKIALNASLLWLDSFQAYASANLITQAEPLFDKLEDITSASYTSSAGTAKQQDLIRAELELLRLNARLTRVNSQYQSALAKLSQFIYQQSHDALHFQLPERLHPLSKRERKQLELLSAMSRHSLFPILNEHPTARAMEQQIKTSNMEIEIAKQGFEPQYGLNASYGIREDAGDAVGLNNGQRPDFFSVGVSINMPLFSKRRQNAEVASSTKMTEAKRTEKRLILREMMANLQSAHAQYKGAAQQQQIYQEQIIPQLKQQSDITLSAYTNDRGDFAGVLRAQIDELNAQLELLEITVVKRKSLATINYYLSHLQEDQHEYVQ